MYNNHCSLCRSVQNQLAELNQYVRVNLVENINDNLLREFKCVVVTEASEEMRMYLSDFAMQTVSATFRAFCEGSLPPFSAILERRLPCMIRLVRSLPHQ